MDRLIVRFLSGAQANQERAYAAAELAAGLVCGRDPASRIVFDAGEDAVSRQHCRIEADPDNAYGFVVIDLKSSNGVFVNGVRVVERAQVEHGDVVRLGAGGPEVSLSADPAPPAGLRPTRVVNVVAQPAPTREMAVEPSAAATAAATPAVDPARQVGRATVERMIGHERQAGKQRLVQVGVLAAAVLALVTGWQFYKGREAERIAAADRAALEQKVAAERAAVDAQSQALQAKLEAARRISDAYSGSTIFIETAWKLVETASGKQVFHMHSQPKKNSDGSVTPKMPMYMRGSDGTIEPVVWTDDGRGLNEAIGGGGTGSGFVVAENGFALTNKHVAAGWNMPYRLPAPGVLVGPDGKGGVKVVGELSERQIAGIRWVPVRAAMLGGKDFEFKRLEGRVDFLDVTFPKNKLRIPARIARVSNEHDVALLKIDTPAPLKKVELWDNYDAVKGGDAVVLLGYPAVSPLGVVATRSREMNSAGQREYSVVPDVTVNQGIISRKLQGSGSHKVEGGTAEDYISMFGDVYQVAINTAGPGNSGGPLFAPDGRVIGIHTYGRSMPGATVSFATPIRYANALMGVEPTLK
jgi:S1-C subfamily serine protease